MAAAPASVASTEAPELGIVWLVVFAAFVSGAASGAHPYDVGELAAAAAQLGGSHAPGQPLHALLGHLVMLVPLGAIPFRLSVLSAIGAATAAFAAGHTVRALRIDRSARVVSVCVAISVALLPAVLRNAMRPEVYTCALACVMLGAWALASRTVREEGEGAGLRVAAVLAGLAFALHPPHAIALAAMAIVSCVVRRPTLRGLGLAIGFGLVALVTLAYLPIRGAAGAPMWGEPTSASGLWAYLTGAAYRRNLGAGDAGPIAQIVDVLRYVALGGGGLALVLSPVAVTRVSLRPVWAMALVAVLGALLQPLEERNPDNVAYFAPALAMIAVAAGTTLVAMSAEGRAWWAASPLLALAPLACAMLGSHLASAELTYLETLAFELLDDPAPRALVVTRTDFVAGAAMMSQSVDGERPDVALFVEGLATSSWHWRSLRGHPPFDGRALRTATPDPRVAYVEGAVGMARGRIEIVAEDAATASEGELRGATLVVSPIARRRGIDERAMGERTMPAIVSTLAWAEAGDHEAGAQVVRHVVLSRTPLLFARAAGDRARAGLVIGAGRPLDVLARAGTGPLLRPLAPLVRDRAFFLCAREDLLREAALVLAASGHPEDATALLAEQADRGDARALLQLAWLQQHDGLSVAARSTLDAYRALGRGSDPDADRLEEALHER